MKKILTAVLPLCALLVSGCMNDAYYEDQERRLHYHDSDHYYRFSPDDGYHHDRYYYYRSYR